tara:strand:- start:1974 stop:2588 length:615 start_codon:yes stop_codon:yes gene_type:complete
MKLNRSTLLSSVKELGFAIATVILLVGALTLISGAVDGIKARRPVPVSPDGGFVLTPYRAVISGDLTLQPTEFEDRESDYEYTHGRSVLKERQERHAENWGRDGDQMTWRFRVDQAGDFQIRLRYAGRTVPSDSQIVIAIDEDPIINAGIGPASDEKEWASTKIGQLRLEPGIHQLTVSLPSDSGVEGFQLKQVDLLPLMGAQN